MDEEGVLYSTAIPFPSPPSSFARQRIFPPFLQRGVGSRGLHEEEGPQIENWRHSLMGPPSASEYFDFDVAHFRRAQTANSHAIFIRITLPYVPGTHILPES